MAVDLASEHVISAHQAAELIPSYRKGKPTHVSRVIRAIQRGQLEGLKFGIQWVTSVEAIQRWGERRATGNAQATPLPSMPRTPTQRRKAVEAAERELAAKGY